MYWQTTEKSTLEQLNSTCNYTAQLKKQTKQQNKQICFTFTLDIANYIPISALGNEGRYLVHYHCTYRWHFRGYRGLPSNSLWARLAL